MKRSDIADEHVLELARAYQDGQFGKRIGVYDALVAEGVPSKLAYAKIKHMVDRGLLDYGVSLCYPWPTIKETQ